MKDRPQFPRDSGDGKSPPERRSSELPKVRSEGELLFVHTKRDPVRDSVRNAELNAELDARMSDKAPEKSLKELRDEAERKAFGESVREILQEKGTRYDQMFTELIVSTQDERLQEARLQQLAHMEMIAKCTPKRRFTLSSSEERKKKKILESVREKTVVEGYTESHGPFTFLYDTYVDDAGREFFSPRVYVDEVISVVYKGGEVEEVDVRSIKRDTSGERILEREEAPKLFDLTRRHLEIPEEGNYESKIIFKVTQEDVPTITFAGNDDRKTFTVSEDPRKEHNEISQEEYTQLFVEGLNLVPHQPAQE